MNRLATFLVGPETVLLALGTTLFWFSSQHDSGQGRDIDLMERLVMSLPFILVPAAFATILIPGSRTWWWLARAVVISWIALAICGGKLISAFGTGAKGQDAAFIIILMLGTVVMSLGTSIASAVILAEGKPAFSAWVRTRPVLGCFLTLLATVPIALVMGITVTVLVSAGAAAYAAIKR